PVRNPRRFPVRSPLHGLHAFLLAGMVPLFLGVLLADLAWSKSWEVQWKNFASWLLVGALLFAGFALLRALVDAVLLRFRHVLQLALTALLLLVWILGFINALLHAGDAAAGLSALLMLSWVLALLSIAATWLGFAGLRHETSP